MEIKDFFQLHKKIAVAFSGGVDSSVLLLISKQYADRVKAYYVRSDFQPDFEYEDALAVAGMLNVETEIITADVLSDSTITDNPPDRCYYCKKRIFSAICEAARRDGFTAVADGTNASDDINDRPGFRALKEMGVLSPLRDFGFDKEKIRKIAKENSLPVASKPSYACLATRITTGVKITEELLEKTEKAEECLRKTGFKNFRVRYFDGNAVLELGKNDFELFYENKNTVAQLLSPYYNNIYLNLRERKDD